MWLFFALLTGLLMTIHNLVLRHTLKKDQNDPWVFSFFFSAVGALVSLPFMLTDMVIAHDIYSWGLMALVGALIVAHNFFRFTAFKHMPASLLETITKTRLIWIMALGIIVLGETSGMLKILGTVLVILAGVIVINKTSKPKDIRGVAYALLAALLFAINIIIYKFLFSSFSPSSLTFFIFLIPAIINLIIMPNSFKRIHALAKNDLKMVMIACTLGGVVNLVTNYALSLGEASKVLVIIESFLIITLIGEHFIIRERENLAFKALAVIFATAGAVLIRLS